jgi:hypothetical protein
MTMCFLVKNLLFFKKYVPNEIVLMNHHLLILDGHGSHFTLEAIKQTQQFGLNMMTLPSNTSMLFNPGCILLQDFQNKISKRKLNYGLK